MSEAAAKALDGELHDERARLQQLVDDLQMREEFSRAVFVAAYDGLLMVDETGDIRDVNPAALSMLGFAQSEVRGSKISTLIDLHANGFADELAPEQMIAVLSAGASKRTEMKALTRDGSLLPVSVTVGVAQVRAATRYVLIVHDLSQEKQAEAALERMAFIDPLTSLGNRYWIRREFEQLAQEGDREICLIYLNLDWFKKINDSLGQRVGDDAISTVAARLAEGGGAVAEAHSYNVSRVGGDEFAVLVSRGSQLLDWFAIAEDLRSRVAKPMLIGGTSVTLRASVGLTTANLADADFDRLVNEADIAMRRAKSEGNHRVQFYEPSMGYRASGAVALEEGIRLGLDRGEFVAHYQPKVDLATGEIHGAEALVRWNHPEAGLLGPGRFMPTAEGSELVALIGEAMLRDVVAFQRRALLEHVARPVAINISSREFGSPALAFEIGQKVAAAGIPPSLVSLEITEGAVTGEGNQYALLNVLRSAGFKVAIDDFGVAQSSLSRLREIPQDEVKVDKAFVDNVPESEIDSNILRAIVSLGAATGSHVVIEGVERQEQLDFLRTLDPVAVQGYVYSPAVPADEYLRLLKDQPWRSLA